MITTVRVTATLALIIGFMMQPILDGQTFTHAVLGVVCGAAAIAGGVYIVRADRSNRREGWTIGGLGLVLGLWCLVMLPSAYRYQQKFNDLKKRRPAVNKLEGTVDQRLQNQRALPDGKSFRK